MSLCTYDRKLAICFWYEKGLYKSKYQLISICCCILRERKGDPLIATPSTSLLSFLCLSFLSSNFDSDDDVVFFVSEKSFEPVNRPRCACEEYKRKRRGSLECRQPEHPRNISPQLQYTHTKQLHFTTETVFP